MTFQAITANLELRTALHMGTGNDTETADDLLRRDARGRLLIPGTAIAGALRSIATRLAPRLPGGSLCHAVQEKDPTKACGCLVCKLFGDVNPQENDETGNVARVLVYDAVLDSSDVQIRDNVGIDRVTGAAARRERIKFDLEVLPAQTKFKLRIEIDPKLKNDENALQLLAAVLAEWQAGRGAVGGRVSRGLGAFALNGAQFIQCDLNQVDKLMDTLRNGPPWKATDGNADWVNSQVDGVRRKVVNWSPKMTSTTARSWALAEFTLAATGPFLTHDLTQAGRSGFDHAPVLVAYAKGSKPVLPGSSLRGVLRSQAERIARTLATQAAWDTANPQQHFSDHCPACNPLTTKTDDPVASCNSFIKMLGKKERDILEQQGADRKLCLACRLFGSTWNGSRLRVEDAPLKEGTTTQYKVLDFLAIDRFTGGGRDSAKFDAVVLWKPKFSVRLFLENPEPWELGWLALVLRDLNDGLATVGFGSAKGFGQCTIGNRKLTIGILHDTDFQHLLPDNQDAASKSADAAGERLLQVKGEPSGLYQQIVYAVPGQADWLLLANSWVKAFSEEVQHKSPHQRGNDSYFTPQANYRLPDLYPARVS